LIEGLYGTSSLVKTPAPGSVYKNINIWVGTSGFASPNNIKQALITFRVDKEWMSANGVSGSDIVLVKWEGNKWINLETRELPGDDDNAYFESKDREFSSFAITALKGPRSGNPK